MAVYPRIWRKNRKSFEESRKETEELKRIVKEWLIFTCEIALCEKLCEKYFVIGNTVKKKL